MPSTGGGGTGLTYSQHGRGQQPPGEELQEDHHHRVSHFGSASAVLQTELAAVTPCSCSSPKCSFYTKEKEPDPAIRSSIRSSIRVDDPTQELNKVMWLRNVLNLTKTATGHVCLPQLLLDLKGPDTSSETQGNFRTCSRHVSAPRVIQTFQLAHFLMAKVRKEPMTANV